MLPAHLPPARMGDRLVPRRRAAPSRQRRPRRLPPPAAARLELGHRHILKLRRATLRARGRAAAADAMAREFGFRRGALNLVNWVSDQYSQYGTKVVSVAEREAIHTLEAILHTQLPILEHTTDTHATTEIVFALFDLLGLRFIPRLRDAGDLRLHRLGPPSGLPVDAVLRSKARPERITEQYDQLLRLAGSLKRGWVPASLLITRMENSSPQTPLAAALSEYGRIVCTNFLLL